MGVYLEPTIMPPFAAHPAGGLPDLLLWRPAPHGDARLVEVKGPTDRLSEQQRAWILAMSTCGLDVEVCKVAEP